MKIFHTEIAVLIGNLFKLERCGRYEDALAELQDIWEDTSKLPDVGEFPTPVAAEILLRCGVLIGFHGHLKQIPDSQENSKNLLTEARRQFETVNNLEKIAECNNYLALAYWRKGELVEAAAWVEETLSYNLNKVSDVWIYCNVIKSLLLNSNEKYEETLIHLKPLESYFQKLGSSFLYGSFCANLGIALKDTGRTSEALKYLELSRFLHQKSQHQIYLGVTENNLALLYKSVRLFDKAHKAIDNATKVFKNVKDLTREGFSFDTKAQIYFAEGEYTKALKIIEKGINILTKSENIALLVETYLTKAKILLYLDDLTAAFLCLSDAVQIAKTNISEERATTLVKEFEIALNEKNSPVINEVFTEKEIAEEKIELILHPSIAHYEEFQGVWIKNSHLESFGLRKGSLAVVTKDKIKRGDLVAISENVDGSVLCGFYDADFGIVCLEGIGEEPRLFDENDITILGKIIGVGNAHNETSGKITVEPLKL
jgi:tetratricopeptide (TPR) repeat protein